VAGAKRPDGKAAKTERVAFTRPAAERIGKVVRIVESGDRGAAGLHFNAKPGNSDRHIRICTFTGAWAIGSPKTVTFKFRTTTPNTVSATNLFWPLDEANDPQERDCSIGRDGTAWFLLTPKLEVQHVFTSITNSACELKFGTLPAIVLATASTNVVTFSPGTVSIVDDISVDTASQATKIVLSRRQISAWCNNAASSTSINLVGVDVIQDATLTTAALEFTRVKAWVFHQSTADTVSISITTCSTATASSTASTATAS
jgi:hypothetical protein